MITFKYKTLLLPLNIKQRKQLEKQKAVSQKVVEIQKVYEENGLENLGCLSTLIQMQKAMGTIIMLLVMNDMFVFMIPSGVGLYYFMSSLFAVIKLFIFLSH